MLSLFLLLNLLAVRGGENCCQAITNFTDDFVVHEWGTFTSFSGSDGVLLDFQTQVKKDLPEYVYDRSRQAKESTIQNGKWAYMARQRMETPVIYFYSEKEREVQVEVQFPKGMLTEFFPPVQRMTPAFDASKEEHIPEWSNLDWGKIKIFPQSSSDGLQDKLPKSKTLSHYEVARATDSSVLRFCDSLRGDFYEKFLFYRGIGNFSLPVKVYAEGNDQFVVDNISKQHVLTSAFLLQVEKQTLRFTSLFACENRKWPITLPKETTTLETVSKLMMETLINQGLYQKEAESMVKTWQDSWFGEEGTRLLFILPRPAIQSALPLQINPAPKQLSRVFVGRVEILTPEKEVEVKQMIESAGSCCGSLQETLVVQQLRSKLGRFAEAAVGAVAKKSEDSRLRDTASSLIAKLSKKDDDC